MNNNIRKQIQLLRRSNLIRHHYVCSPLINYTKYGIEENCSFLDPDIFPQNEKTPTLENTNYNPAVSLTISDNISPRFVNFHEIMLALYREELNSTRNIKENILEFKNIFESARDIYNKINKKSITDNDNIIIEKKQVFKDAKVEVQPITFTSDYKAKELCIGLVNMKLNDEYIKQSFLQNPILNNPRREQFNGLLNLVKHTEQQIKSKIKRNIDILVFPELSVPYKALDWLCDYAQRNQIMMIFGVEHWVSNNIAYNLIATLIPYTLKISDNSEETINCLLPLFRIKNHYAPDEESILKSYRYEIPIPSPSVYFLFNWKGVRFSVFNCFELANIQHRAIFRGEVDALFACEYNADTHYYSNIVESVVRDLHCYFIQSNDAKNGDSRITRPTSSVIMNQIQIKGGENTSIIIDTIDIKSIRDHQIQNNIGREKPAFFKPTPPGFEIDKAMDRNGKQLNQK